MTRQFGVLNVAMLNDIMVNVIMLNVVILKVRAAKQVFISLVPGDGGSFGRGSNLGPGPNVIKLFTDVIYEFS